MNSPETPEPLKSDPHQRENDPSLDYLLLGDTRTQAQRALEARFPIRRPASLLRAHAAAEGRAYRRGLENDTSLNPFNKQS